MGTASYNYGFYDGPGYMMTVSASGYPEQIATPWLALYFPSGSRSMNFGICNSAVYKAGRRATIILPTEPDPALGRYFRLDRVDTKENKVFFEREHHPQADVPYVIFPDRDFRVEFGKMELPNEAGKTAVEHARLVGTYKKKTCARFENEVFLLFDDTDDCGYMLSEFVDDPFINHDRCILGAMHALLELDYMSAWNEEELESMLVFHDDEEETPSETSGTETEVAEGASAMAGFVLDQDRKPVSGATVTLKADGREYSCETDGYGHYLLPVDDATLPYSIGVKADGYHEQEGITGTISFTNGPVAQGFTISNTAHYTKGVKASYITRYKPDASLGSYYRIDRVEDDRVVFCREKDPQADVPYVIVPGEDFDIEYSSLFQPLEGKTTEVKGARLMGTYRDHYYTWGNGEYGLLPDFTPDCEYMLPQPHWTLDGGARVGANRALLVLDSSVYDWAGRYDFYDYARPLLVNNISNHVIVLSEEPPTGITEIPQATTSGNPVTYDLQGRRLQTPPSKGVYISGGKKSVR
jgi:hypothetical protein